MAYIPVKTSSRFRPSTHLAVVTAFIKISAAVTVAQVAEGTNKLLWVAGSVRQFQVERSGTTNLVASRRFEATGTAATWSVRSWSDGLLARSAHDAIESKVVSSDGVDIFYKIETNPEKYEEKKKAPSFSKAQSGPMAMSVTNQIVVYSASMPYMDSAFTSAIWLPFFGAGSGVWKTNKTTKNIFSMDERVFLKPPLSFAMTPVAEAQNIAGLIQLRNAGTYFIRESNGSYTEKKRKAPYTNGFVEFQYNAYDGEMTSLGWIPKRSTVQYFRSKPGANSSDDTELYSLIEVTASDIKVTSGTVVAPNVSLLGQMTHILDKRQSDLSAKPVSYVTTNRVIETNSNTYNEIKTKQIQRDDAVNWFKSKFSKRMTIFLAFVGVTSLCGFGVWRIVNK